MAVWVILGLIAYLRPNENMKLRRADLLKPIPSTKTWGLLIAPSETGAVSKTNEQDDSVLLDNPSYLWLEPIFIAMKDGTRELPLWDFDYSQVAAEIRNASEAFQIADLYPYGLRHSGPSEDRARSVRTLEEIRKRGRWASAKSVQRYEKAARLAATYETYSAEFKVFSETCDRVIADVVLGKQSAPIWGGDA